MKEIRDKMKHKINNAMNAAERFKEGLCSDTHRGRKLKLFKSSQNWCTGAFEHAEQEYQLYFSMRTTKT